jgi:Zn-dependent M28 family amino/carboxypeptidase
VVARLWSPLPVAAMAAGAALSIVAGYLAGRGRLKGKSPGARDNGSGLLAALVAAQEINHPSVGILVTGAEEFGLIGSRYFAEKSPELVSATDVINIDTVDSQGFWRLVIHRPGSEDLIQRMASILAGLSPLRIKRHRLPAGIFVDSLPLARAGARAITLARLDWGTLGRIHTPRDTLEGLSLDSAVVAGQAIAKALAD